MTPDAYTTEVLPLYTIQTDQRDLLKMNCSGIACDNPAKKYQVIRIAGLQFLVTFCDECAQPLEDWFRE